GHAHRSSRHFGYAGGRQKPLSAVGQARSSRSDLCECSGLRGCLSAKTRPVTASTRRTPSTAVAAFCQNGVPTAAPFDGRTTEAAGIGSGSIAAWATVVATIHQVAAPTSMAIKRRACRMVNLLGHEPERPCRDNALGPGELPLPA